MAPEVVPMKQGPNRNPKSTFLTRTIGGVQATIFSLTYLVTPGYMLSCMALPFVAPLGLKDVRLAAYMAPLLLSACFKTKHCPGIVKTLTSMLTYFDYEEVHETSDQEMLDHFAAGKKYILAAQPHGVISFTGMCSAVYAIDEFRKISKLLKKKVNYLQ